MNCILEENENTGSLYLGNLDAASDMKLLDRHNIRAVLTVAVGLGLRYHQDEDIDHLVIHAEDVESYNLSRHFEKATEFIERHRKNKRNVLIHCYAGVSRSATITIAYLMKNHKFSYIRAHDFVKNKRGCISPNVGFRVQLREYERRLHQSFSDSNSTSFSTPYSTTSRLTKAISTVRFSPLTPSASTPGFKRKEIDLITTGSAFKITAFPQNKRKLV